MKLPSQRAITKNIASGAARIVRHEIANGSEYIYDLISTDDLLGMSAEQRVEYDRRVAAGVEIVARRIEGRR